MMRKTFAVAAALILIITALQAEEMINEPAVRNVDSALLLSFSVNKDSVDEDSVVPFFNSYIFADTLKNAAIKHFNKTNSYFKLNEIEEELLSSSKGLNSLSESNYICPGTLDDEALSDSDINALLEKSGADYYMVIDSELKLFEQTVILHAGLYNKEHSLIWAQSSEAWSTYILKDPNSPHAGDYNASSGISYTADPDAAHTGELRRVVKEAAVNAADLLVEELDSQLDALREKMREEEKEKWKALRKKRRKERWERRKAERRRSREEEKLADEEREKWQELLEAEVEAKADEK